MVPKAEGSTRGGHAALPYRSKPTVSTNPSKVTKSSKVRKELEFRPKPKKPTAPTSADPNSSVAKPAPSANAPSHKTGTPVPTPRKRASTTAARGTIRTVKAIDKASAGKAWSSKASAGSASSTESNSKSPRPTTPTAMQMVNASHKLGLHSLIYATLGRNQPFVKKVPEEQKSIQRKILDIWGDEPHKIIQDQSRQPRTSTVEALEGSEPKVEVIEESSGWPKTMLKLFLLWAQRSKEVNESQDESITTGRICVNDFACKRVNERRKNKGVAADSTEYGMIFNDVVNGYEDWKAYHPLT